ncbi:hypothetical protein OnM2_055029 [Erysiphe neolycopersici]|uniref:Nineteen complex-related protein 2 domain-containing protein n=1 Tax=Erysiphe neolycopersici TaxID=212602 RepID=A0A420HRF0_9PEZI|nr:hypothetical protein OnM2_055029 [Erysiphe neolycopersici]
MNATFRSRRKAVKILVDDDEDEDLILPTASTGISSALPSDSDSQKKKISINDEVGIINNENENISSNSINNFTGGDRKYGQITGYKKKEKKKKNLAKLSFGFVDNALEETIPTDSENQLKDAIKLSKKGEKHASKFRKGVSLKSLPVHFSETHNERPTYSKDYLNELKNSTPAAKSQILDDSQDLAEEVDEVSLTDFQGTLITTSQSGTAIIPTEAEIREKKERRARLAREADFISFDEDNNDHRILLPQAVKTESRLVRDDEDFAEGFDEFVEDERIALGNKQERQARRRKRKEIAEMIQQAEAISDEELDDSETERCVAYENAQTRAGMDGLQRNEIEEESVEERMPTNITPLPILSECLARFQNKLSSMKIELEQQKMKLLEAEQEERDIITRELEVQALLAQAGEQLEAMSSGLLDTAQDSAAILENP